MFVASRLPSVRFSQGIPRVRSASSLDQPGLAGLVPVTGLARFVLRCDAAVEPLAGSSMGLALPAAINRGASKGERGMPGARVALRLGPDELLLIVPEADGEAVRTALAAALAGHPHSLVEVSSRNVGFVLAGPHAADMLNAGCPLELSLAAFPIGMATRTIFHKAEITLWRVAENAFRIEIGRSFAPYLVGMIEETARDFA